MNLNIISFVGISLFGVGCSTIMSHDPISEIHENKDTTIPYQRVVISADMVTYWKKTGDPSHPSTQYSDASYILYRKEEAWHLTEQSIRMDSGVHYLNEYGVIDEKDAQIILTAACELARTETGNMGGVCPPGGPVPRAFFQAHLYSHAPLEKNKTPWKWKIYENSDAKNSAYRNLMSVTRTVAKKYGSVLPLTGLLNDLDTPK